MIVSLSAVVAMALAAPPAAPAENVVLGALVNQGVKLASGEVIKLPPPTLVDGMDAAAQRAAIESVTKPNYSFADMARNAITAPVKYVQTSEKLKSGDNVRRFDLWFIVYGDWDKLTDKKYMEQKLKENKPVQQNEPFPPRSEEITGEDLAARGLEVAEIEGGREGYVFTEFSIFEKVLVSGGTHYVQTTGQDSVTIAAVVDPRFNGDAKFPNQWKPIKRNVAGKFAVGQPSPYEGSASYVKVTKLAEPAGAIAVELHAFFFEPKGWFNGLNMLGSKIPQLVPTKTREFRGELLKLNDAKNAKDEG